MATLVMDANKAIAVRDCLARQIDELMEHGWCIKDILKVPEYKNLVDVCNEIADAYPEAELERY